MLVTVVPKQIAGGVVPKVMVGFPGIALITALDEEADVQLLAFFTLNVKALFGTIPVVIVVVAPVPEVVATSLVPSLGVTIQVPVVGNPDRATLGLTEQVG